MKREYVKPESELFNVKCEEIMEDGVITTSPSDEVGANAGNFDSEEDDNQLPSTFSLWDEGK